MALETIVQHATSLGETKQRSLFMFCVLCNIGDSTKPCSGSTNTAFPYSGLRFDVMNKLNAHGGLFVGQKAAAAAGAHM